MGRVEAEIDRWRTELLDLSKSNRLVYLRRGTGALTMSSPKSDDLFEGLANRGKKFSIFREDDDDPASQSVLQLDELLGPETTAESAEGFTQTNRVPLPHEIVIDGEPKKTSAALYRMRLRARSALEEQGINVLFAAFGTIEWKETSTSAITVTSPLVLVPVRLDRPTALDSYTLSPLDESAVFNPALALKLERDFGLKVGLPEDNDEDLSLQTVLSHVRASIPDQHHWIVRSEAILGVFSFAKYVMYRDLERNQARFASHPVVRLISGEDDSSSDLQAHLPSADELDDLVAPVDVFQVLDADASQQETIAAVKAGTSLVVQGPPGTGKSQTITNLISESLAQGKTVLFVSEKMAALRVVAKRLEETGLKEFCLEAHSQDAKKSEVIHDLARILEAGPDSRSATSAQMVDLERIQIQRAGLNAYTRALHDDRNPLGRSAFAIHGEIASRSQVAVVPFTLPDVNELTSLRLAQFTDVAMRLAQAGPVLFDEDDHPWRDCSLMHFSPAEQTRFDALLRNLSIRATDLANVQQSIRHTWHLSDDTSLNATCWLEELLQHLNVRPNVPAHWLNPQKFDLLLATARSEREIAVAYRSKRADLLTNYQPSVLNLDFTMTIPALEAGGAPLSSALLGNGEHADRAILRRDGIEKALTRMLDAVAAVSSATDDLSNLYGIHKSATLRDARTLQFVTTLVLREPRPLTAWFAPNRLAQLTDLAEQASKHAEALKSARDPMLSRFPDEILEVATPEMAGRFDNEYRVWYRFLKSGYQQDISRLQHLLREPAKFGYGEALDLLRQARRFANANAWLGNLSPQLSTTFGHHYRASHTDWTSVVKAVAIVSEIENRLGTVPHELSSLLVSGDGGATAHFSRTLDAAIVELEGAWGHLQSLLSPKNPHSGEDWLPNTPLTVIAAWGRLGFEGFRRLWTASDSVHKHLRIGTPTAAQLLVDARRAQALHKVETEFAMRSIELESAFGHFFAGLETDWDAVLAALAWTGRLHDTFSKKESPHNIPVGFIEAVVAGTSTATAEREFLSASISEIERLFEALRESFNSDSLIGRDERVQNAPLLTVAEWARTLHSALPRLEEWIDKNSVVVDTANIGLQDFLEELRLRRPPFETWRDVLLRQLYTLWLSERYSSQQPLAEFRSQRHQDLINDFRKLDRMQLGLASRRIIPQLRAKRPALGFNTPPRSEPGILQREAIKKKRFRPLRKLFAEIPNLLPALKPCLLMSPLSVAQFFGESEVMFDLVVFDEASQILPADAIGAIGRGKQVVVVGDQQQLPPTRFFVTDGQTDDGDEDEEMPESILDACLGQGMPSKRLLWHYRSRHEDLIAFSNKYFYEGRLITFPSPDSGSRRAVEFIHAEDGVYDRAATRANRVEASRIADMVVEHAFNGSQRSLGVITFSEAQQVAVQAEIDSRKRDHPELEELLREDGPDGFFVKNLENVQGDERDVIFFSVGYGPDKAGHMTMTFGPLNRTGGERRLNVAVTRAREQVKIVASFLPHQIDRSRTKAKGVHLLRSYLEFAAQGPIALLGELTGEGGAPDSLFEESVATALEARGLRVVSQVGVGGFRIDLGIKDSSEDRYVLGVECDGATYHSSKTARDRDRLRQEVLERLGWRIHRIWSTDWVKDPIRETERVLAAYAEAREELLAQSSVTPPAKVQSNAPNSRNSLASDRQEQSGRIESILRTGQSALSSDEVLIPSMFKRKSGEPAIETTSQLNPSRVSEGRNFSPGSRPHGALAPSLELMGISEPYVRVRLPTYGTLDDFWNTATKRLAELVENCVKVEGPVHEERILEAVTQSYQIARTGGRIRSAIFAAIEMAERRQTLTRAGPFLWPASMKVPPVRARDTNGTARPIERVAPWELEVAVRTYLAKSFSIGREDLVSGVAREMGYERTGPHISVAIEKAIDRLINQGQIKLSGGQLRLTS